MWITEITLVSCGKTEKLQSTREDQKDQKINLRGKFS